MSTRIWMVRHGQTEWNVTGRFQGQSDTPLNALGERQARAAGRQLRRLAQADAWVSPSLRETGGRLAAIYTSDLERARRTAEIICEELEAGDEAAIDRETPLVIEPRLRELSFGEWEGLTYAQIQAYQPDILELWRRDLEQHAPPGGETLRQMAGRVQAALDAILAAHPDGRVVVVAHGGPLQMLTALALGLPASRYWQVYMANGSLSELRVHPEGAILNLLNSCEHLEEG
jgi:broad specificity phosphatase PhoE